MSIVDRWKRRRWTTRREVKALENALGDLTPGDDEYAPALNSIEQLTRIRNTKIETGVKALKEIGMLAICGAVAVAAYSIDKSDEIPRNKTSMNVFGRIARF